jgi:nicotinate-nucleotide adenylyltransferase
MAMIAEAIEPFGNAVEVSGIENTFEPPFYANKPLNYFREKYKDDDLTIICGSDTANKIPFWKNAIEDILPFYEILSLERDENKSNSGFVCRWAKGPDEKRYMYTHVFINALPVSSTLIRKLIKEDKNVYPLIPSCAIDIINKNSLYKD